MKRKEPYQKPIAHGAAYMCGYNHARLGMPYNPIETFEWKQGYRDCAKDIRQTIATQESGE